MEQSCASEQTCAARVAGSQTKTGKRRVANRDLEDSRTAECRTAYQGTMNSRAAVGVNATPDSP